MKIILFIVGVLLLVILGLVAFAPTTVKVDVSTTIDASQNRVFNEASSFKARESWNPWSQLDPEMKSEITGQDGKVGAKYTWSGNSDIGKGEQEIVAVHANDRIDTKLTFIEPWESEADTYITLSEAEGVTQVHWGFESEAPRPMNVMMLFMKGAIASDYEKGLNMLKKIVDENPVTWEVKEVDMPERHYIGRRKKISMMEITAFYSEVFPAVFGFSQQKGIPAIGMPQGLYFSYSEDNMSTDLAGVIAVEDASQVGDAFEVFTVPAGKAMQMDYYGSYSEISKGHDEFEAYLKRHKLKGKLPVSEEYVTDPTTVSDPSEVLTRITYWLE